MTEQYETVVLVALGGVEVDRVRAVAEREGWVLLMEPTLLGDDLRWLPSGLARAVADVSWDSSQPTDQLVPRERAAGE